MRTLLGLSFSPWTEKARWALERQGVFHRYREYVPLLGEPALRVRTHRLRGRVTVPVLFDHGVTFTDSFDIARRADDLRKDRPTLFPRALEKEIEAWNEKSERGLAAGRALYTVRLAHDEEAKSEALPRFIPAPLRGLLTPLATVGTRYVLRKYGVVANTGHFLATITELLEELRASIAKGPHLLGELTYADLAMAVVVQFVRPVDQRFLRLGPATRRAWETHALAEKFPDVIAWRDRLYESCRTPRAERTHV